MIPLALQTVKQVRFVIALDSSVVNAFEVLSYIMGQKTWSEHSYYQDFITFFFSLPAIPCGIPEEVCWSIYKL